MIGFLSAYDEGSVNVPKDKVSFVHINSSDRADIEQEISPLALCLARKFNLDKVYLFYGKEKILYDYSL